MRLRLRGLTAGWLIVCFVNAHATESTGYGTTAGGRIEMKRGIETGDLEACDTFATAEL
ncbi:hypothetical protein SVA_2566 [Sulfurifustis variabilis]|uniref:Uncharacterized protein n=1 Tax=Sulfurifustis variabilis TaxID=1675686 RepID=A0A1B4VAZ9_9GAMM|nr:hypothetical protein [Sulfurifustis variabilis]BAU49114.1 hypothetical protein SVA_2566 [Sulfurifustis variabilis]